MGAMRWNDLFAVLFVMRPHTYYLDGLHVIEDLIDETMLNIDSSRESPGKITHEFLVRRRILARVVL